MSLPLILAGPILRRVEPRLVSVWVALSEESRVELFVWHDEEIVAVGDGVELFDNRGHDFTALTNTKRLGDKLHIAVVTLNIAAEDPALLPGRLYSYNLKLTPSEDPSQRADLKSTGLLKNGLVNGKPHLALGYDEDILPSFAMPPDDITKLHLIHGSCRRINQEMEDGLSWVDNLIQDTRTDPFSRPHQLFLSGDQIYADDVALPLLPQLITCGNELIGGHEYLPTIWPHPYLDADINTVKYWPADTTHFPPGMRHKLIDSEARMTTVDKHSHLISFGEFAAMYLYVWSNTLWDLDALDDFDKTIDARQGEVETVFPNWGALFQHRNPEGVETVEHNLLRRFVDLIFNQLSAEERREAIVGVEFKPRFNPENLTIQILEKDPPDETRFRPIYNLARELLGATPADAAVKQLDSLRGFMERLQESFAGLYRKKEDKRKKQVLMLYDTLPKVRRALANVPTYMMFDDHEVTDDWYLNPIWRDRVLTSPLGKTIIRNGLLAYALFQGWGNDPEVFKTGEYATLLNRAAELFPTEQTTPPEHESDVAREIDLLLGLDGADPPVRWHYKVVGPKHMVVALDNRTRRSFTSRISAPGNVSLTALPQQIPAGPLPPGVEVLIVVAPLPVLGPPVFDEIIAPAAYKTFDLVGYVTGSNRDILSGIPGTNPDAIEAWAFDPETFEALLKRLQPYQRVVLLSGDVHYGASQVMSYWKKGEAEPARFAQFTSSGLRNVMPSYIQVVSQTLAVAQRMARSGVGAERLGWDADDPLPVSFPPGATPTPVLRDRLHQSPVLVAPQALPDQTEAVRPADWEWRVTHVRDERPEPERPEPTRAAPLPTATDPLERYQAVASRHGAHLHKFNHTRQILFTNNLGVVRFERHPQGNANILWAVHELHAVHPEAIDPRIPEAYAIHKVPLQAPQDRRPSELAFATGGEV